MRATSEGKNAASCTNSVSKGWSSVLTLSVPNMETAALTSACVACVRTVTHVHIHSCKQLRLCTRQSRERCPTVLPRWRLTHEEECTRLLCIKRPSTKEMNMVRFRVFRPTSAERPEPASFGVTESSTLVPHGFVLPPHLSASALLLLPNPCRLALLCAGLGILWLTRNSKLICAGFAPGSPAKAAGVKSGDILKSVDGTDILQVFVERANPFLLICGVRLWLEIILSARVWVRTAHGSAVQLKGSCCSVAVILNSAACRR